VSVEIAPAVVVRPRFAGSNIRTWIGFKHLMHLVEEALLDELRRRGAGPRTLYHEHGLGIEILDSSVQLPALVELDDELEAHVTAARPPGRFDVRLTLRRGPDRVLAVRGRLTVALVAEQDPPATAPPPDWLAELVRDDLATAGVEDRPPSDGALAWSWTARYPLCHYSDRVQHSAFVYALEEVVDRFLADRGLSIRTMLDTRGWIPVVSRARVRLLAPTHMEEVVHTTFAVTDVLRSSAFDARMDCHVERGDRRVHVATAQILHGYAAFSGPSAGALVELDDATVAALTRPGGP
jgi:acyl-CoA thioesterase FadM